VRPGVSKTLPVIGAIAGGPVGAAAGLALQAIFRNALGEAAEARYTITGTWENPVIERIGKIPDNVSSTAAPENATPPETPPETPPDIEQESETGTGEVTGPENGVGPNTGVKPEIKEDTND